MELTREIRDRRIAVMQDVVDRLDGEQPYRLQQGAYLYGDAILNIRSLSLKDFVEIASKECRCCFLGAAFLSWMRVESPEFSCEYLGTDRIIDVRHTLISDYFDGLFDAKILGLMESAFERDPDFALEVLPEKKAHKAAGFSASHGLDHIHDLARAIAQNVIDHDGEFVP